MVNSRRKCITKLHYYQKKIPKTDIRRCQFLDYRDLDYWLLFIYNEFSVGKLYVDGVAWLYLFFDDEVGYRVFDVLLDGTAKRTCSKLFVVTLFGYPTLGFGGDVEVVAYLLDALDERTQFDVDNLYDAVLCFLFKRR